MDSMARTFVVVVGIARGMRTEDCGGKQPVFPDAMAQPPFNIN